MTLDKNLAFLCVVSVTVWYFQGVDSLVFLAGLWCLVGLLELTQWEWKRHR